MNHKLSVGWFFSSNALYRDKITDPCINNVNTMFPVKVAQTSSSLGGTTKIET